ncbi:chorismate-binding protein [Streptomyces johnsoniae]|uniref:Chorismate-binding protein n=1 Tax=Streptomyces johnsoniae TaxID=3075532 RepID=A0ABU2S2K8_9ACTN|nr:chorismate-binding protein [Streptomyces sp. DSM 41886]MDT0443013.1 chorismate-binding protein [Streptomyces sp. DSM 41886]
MHREPRLIENDYRLCIVPPRPAPTPAVTASGIPKRRARDWIDEAEPSERALYSGAVIVADGDGGLDAALVLRSVFRRPSPSRTTSCGGTPRGRSSATGVLFAAPPTRTSWRT